MGLCQQGVDAVLGAEVAHAHCQAAGTRASPRGSRGGGRLQSAHGNVITTVVLVSQYVNVGARVGEVQGREEEAKRRQRQAERPQRPGEAGCGTGAHPADFTSLFLAPAVTDPLYSPTVSQALRQPLRGEISEQKSFACTRLPVTMWRCREQVAS